MSHSDPVFFFDSTYRLKRTPALFRICSFKNAIRLQRVGRLPVDPCSIGRATPPSVREPIGRENTDRKFCWMTSLCGCYLWERRTRDAGRTLNCRRTGRRICLLRTYEPPGPRLPPVQACPHMDGVGNAWNNAPACVLGVRRSGLGGLVRRRVAIRQLVTTPFCARCRPRASAPLARGLARASPDFSLHHSTDQGRADVVAGRRV
jgi:hypothetical protein